MAPAAAGLVLLLIGLFRSAVVRERVIPVLAIVGFAVMLGCAIWRFDHPASIVSDALAIDKLSLTLDMLFAVAGIATVLLSWDGVASRDAGQGEYHSLLLFSAMGMAVFVSAQNLVTLFVGIELLSIPLYILCASESRREHSLESGLKYLVIGSVGSATLAYGLALIYGATGSTDFSGIAGAIAHGKLGVGIAGDPMLLTGLGLAIAGFAFKASVAPFHQWTPDVYEGAPTPITAFMATATKAAALGVFIRFFDIAAFGVHDKWAPLLAAVAAITMIVGNVGALGQSSLKRMLGYSGVAQAGYMLGGVVVGTRLGIQATVLYLLAYLAMNYSAFAVIVAQERELGSSDVGGDGGDDISALAGLGARNPLLAWPITISMLALAGIPGHGRVHRQVPADPRARRRQLHVAGDRARDRLDDLAGLLPARDRRGVDARAGGAAAGCGGRRRRWACSDRRRIPRGRRSRGDRRPVRASARSCSSRSCSPPR